MKENIAVDLAFHREHALRTLAGAKNEAIKRIEQAYADVVDRMATAALARGELPLREIDLRGADRILTIDFHTQGWGHREIGINLGGGYGPSVQLAEELEKDADYRAIVLLYKR